MNPHRARLLFRTVLATALTGAGMLSATSAAAGPADPAAVPAVLAQQGSARVAGEIHSHYGSGWIVELIRAGEVGPAHAVATGEDAAFEFPGVVPGDYVLRAFHPESGTTGPHTPVTLRPGDNGSMTLVLDGPPPGELPDRLAPLTGRVEGAAADASDVVVEVLSDRGGELVRISSAPVAEDGTFSVDPQVVEGHALPLHLRAVQVLPDGTTEAVYHGQSPTSEGATPIVPAEGVEARYELSFAEAYGRPGPVATERTTPATEVPATATEEPAAAAGTGPSATLWAVLGAAAAALTAAVAVVVLRRSG